MEKDDKGSTMIRMGVSGECSFWYRPTRVVPDQRPLNGRCCWSLLFFYSLIARCLLARLYVDMHLSVLNEDFAGHHSSTTVAVCR